MASFDLNSAKKRTLAWDVTGSVLKLCNVFVSVQGYNSVIMVSSSDEHSWILLGLDVVKWRILQEEVDVTLLISTSIIRGPSMTNSELMESEHVSDRHLTNCGSKEILPLIGSCSNKKTAIGSTIYHKIVSISETFLDQKLSCCNEIIKSVLLVLFDALLVPGVTELTASS